MRHLQFKLSLCCTSIMHVFFHQFSTQICILHLSSSPHFNSFLLYVLIHVADSNKDKQKNALFCSIRKKNKKQKTKNTQLTIIVELSHMIHHVNKIIKADFQTLAISSHGCNVMCWKQTNKTALQNFVSIHPFFFLASYQLSHFLLKFQSLNLLLLLNNK